MSGSLHGRRRTVPFATLLTSLVTATIAAASFQNSAAASDEGPVAFELRATHLNDTACQSRPAVDGVAQAPCSVDILGGEHSEPLMPGHPNRTRLTATNTGTAALTSLVLRAGACSQTSAGRTVAAGTLCDHVRITAKVEDDGSWRTVVRDVPAAALARHDVVLPAPGVSGTDRDYLFLVTIDRDTPAADAGSSVQLSITWQAR